MGRRYTSTNYFSPHDSNTTCDVTGFKVKRSQVLRRWDGTYMIPEAWELRHPQDFPVAPVPQQVFEDIRIENLDTDTVPTFDKV